MAEFSHDELQQVIRKYDAGLQRMRTAITEKTEKITGLEQQMAKTNQQMEEMQQLSEMQTEENKTLKQHVASFNEENNSLKKLVSVLEADAAKLDDLEAELE